jgi:hypothetical protein
MRLACLLGIVGALACAAQERGFINRSLLKADLLTPRPATTKGPKAPEQRCIRVDSVERIVPPKVDEKMLVPMKDAPSIDRGILVPTLPFCRDVPDQGRPKN